MAKKRTSRRRSFLNTQTIFKFVRIGGLLAPGVSTYASTGGGASGVAKALGAYAGIDPYSGQFSWARLGLMWTPYLMSSLVTNGIGKLNGIIRRL